MTKHSDDFVHVGSWFDKQYLIPLDSRGQSMRAALSLLRQRGGTNIVETGSMRQENDYGAGCSSLIFCEYAKRYGAYLWTVDSDQRVVAFCNKATDEFAQFRKCIRDDSVSFLHTGLAQDTRFNGKIDLLYLDSYDWPAGQLWDIYGGKQDLHGAIAKLDSMTEEEIVRKHADLVIPPQAHCLNELLAAWKYVHNKTVILIDDNGFAGGGKPRLARLRLYDLGWECVMDGQQTLWICPNDQSISG